MFFLLLLRGLQFLLSFMALDPSHLATHTPMPDKGQSLKWLVHLLLQHPASSTSQIFPWSYLIVNVVDKLGISAVGVHRKVANHVKLKFVQSCSLCWLYTGIGIDVTQLAIGHLGKWILRIFVWEQSFIKAHFTHQWLADPVDEGLVCVCLWSQNFSSSTPVPPLYPECPW